MTKTFGILKIYSYLCTIIIKTDSNMKIKKRFITEVEFEVNEDLTIGEFKYFCDGVTTNPEFTRQCDKVKVIGSETIKG